MKEGILKILQSTDDFVSGQIISDTLGVSRNSIWKHINNLKKEGYIIEGVSKKGYKLIKETDIPNQLSVKKFLTTNSIGLNIYDYKILDSTNTKAKELAIKGAKDGSVVISQMQSLGNGRFNRVWHSPLGGIWSSLILKPAVDPQDAHKITLIAACAIYKTLNSLGINAKIKWPNDIYINDKKCAGILTTMNCDMDKINYVIVGIGLNVNIDSSTFDDNSINATSLSIELSKKLNMAEVFASLLNNFEPLYNEFILNNDISEVIHIFKEHSYGLNNKAKLVTVRGFEEVTPVEIDDSGELIVKTASGELKKVLSGEITFH